jgi:DNA-binding transcriptional MerR regulator
VTLLYSIGELSRMTGITVKALRLYQERGLLRPTRVDDRSGYRYYAAPDVDRARLIRVLRDLQLSLDEIRSVLDRLDDAAPLADALARARARLAGEVASGQRALQALEALVQHDEQARAYLRAPPPVVLRELPGQLAAAVRARGQYCDGNQVFPRLLAAVGNAAAGPPFCLYHEAEHRETDADISWCVPVVHPPPPAAGLVVEPLPPVQAATIVHTGPWDSVGLSWARLFAHARADGREPGLPLRETYLRGPDATGGAPRTYVTELALGWA